MVCSLVVSLFLTGACCALARGQNRDDLMRPALYGGARRK
jgi:hypothetical protein